MSAAKREVRLMTKRLFARVMLPGVILGYALGLATALSIGPASAAPSSRSDSPPQCFTVRISEPGAARALWTRFCGTGAGGTSPLEEGVSGHGPLVVDGAQLTPADCTRTQPCVILWPSSPQKP